MTTSTYAHAHAGKANGDPVAAELKALAREAIADNPDDLASAVAQFADMAATRVELALALVGEPMWRRLTSDFVRRVRLDLGNGEEARASAAGGALRDHREAHEAARREAAIERANAEARAKREARLRALERSVLETHLVGGKPLGLATRGELRADAAMHKRHAAFNEAIVGMMPEDDAAVVKEHVSAKVAERLWKSAAKAA